jgi:chromosome segregation ATPase
MANSSTPHTPAVVQKISTKKSNRSDQVKAEVTMALSTLDRLYKENISSYANELHACTHKIEKLQSRLALLLKEKEPHTATLQTYEKDIDYTLRLLERLTEVWSQKSLVIRELESELSQLNHSPKEREQILKSRNETLENLAIEIEDVELSLLEHELQKQNILLLMEPMEREIKTLEQSIKDLESEKRYIESAYLHQISPTSTSSNHTLIDKTNVINTKH